MMTSQAQPVLYFLSLALIGSGFLMALIGLLTLFSASKEHLGLISLVSLINHIQGPGHRKGEGGSGTGGLWQSALFQLGGADYAHHITTALPLKILDLPPPLQDVLGHGLRTPNEALFSLKSQTFGLGKTNWADKFGAVP
jgi:hypothetical protein